MQVQRVLNLTAPDGMEIPGVVVTPPSPKDAVALLHATGGCKEQMMAFALRLAEQRVASLSIDLGGHGESEGGFGLRIASEVGAAIDRLKRDFERVGCAGVGSGGRLALGSCADYVVAIAPPTAGILRPSQQRFDTPFDVTVDETEDSAAPVLRQLADVAQSDRPCLLVLPEDDLASGVIVRALEPLLKSAEARFVTTVSSPHERRLPREWRLMQNDAVIDTTCQWLARTAERARQEEPVHV